MNRSLLGIVLVASGAAMFGTLSYIAREAGAAGLDPLPFVAWRGIVATIVLVAVSVALGTRVGGTRPYPDVRILAPDRRIALIVAGTAGGLLNIAMFMAFARTEIAIALMCFYTYPAIVTIAAVPLYGDRLDRRRLGALALACVGLVLVVLGPLLGSSSIVIDPLGVGLALFAALCQATFILISGRGWRPMPNLHVATYVVGIVIVLSLPLAIIAGQLAGVALPFHEPNTWFWILAGGITGAAIPTTAFITGIGLIGPSRAAILMTVEPLVGVTLAAVLLGEEPGPLQLLGGASVLFAAAVLQLAARAPVAVEQEIGPLV